MRSTRLRVTLLLAVVMLASACAPTAVIQNMLDGQSVSGVITIDNEVTPDPSAGLDDANENISGIDIPLDPTTHDGVLDTTALPNGEHTITLNASNADGTATDQVTVNVQNVPEPIPGSVNVVGDSLTVQAFYPNGLIDENNEVKPLTLYGNAPADLSVHAWLGWKATDVQQFVTDNALAGRAEVTVVALGTNDSQTLWGADGWTENDLANFRTLLDTSHSSACKVLVLPGYGAGVNPTHAPQMDEARTALQQLAAERSDVIIRDWQAVINEHPEYIDTDGIHLLTPETTPSEDIVAAAEGDINTVDITAAEARQNLYWDGVAECQEQFALAG